MNLVYVTAEDIWILVDPYTDPDFGITVPSNYRTNLASIPRCLWPIIAPFELSEVAPVVHDYLYDSKIRTRKEADKIFRFIMRREGVPAWRRFCAYWAVRFFAGDAWKNC